jgi:multiple sugar transport system permease protein
MSLTTARPRVDAQAPHVGGAAISLTTARPRVSHRLHSRLHYRLRRYASEAVCMALGFAIVVWSVTPIYNMWMIALNEHSAIFSGALWPEAPTLEAFRVVIHEDFWYLERFWHQFGNSFYVGLMVMFLTLFIGSLASFTVGRMRLRHGWMLTNAALMTYVIPASFLAIPMYRIMQIYGLSNHLSSVILALTTFATPYAIFIFSQYGKSIPMELDESARIDGANPWQIYFRIYLPLMAPALVAVGTYALLLAWNEYLYNFLLLSSPDSMTVAVALAQFLNSDESPWNFMMATAIIYAMPPIILYYGFRRYMAAGLTMGGVKG